MKYRIDGTRPDGSKCSLLIDAENEDEAFVISKGQGVFITSIAEHSQESARQAASYTQAPAA